MMGRLPRFRHMDSADGGSPAPSGSTTPLWALALALAPACAAAQSPPASLLEGVSGCWERRSERSTTVERWGDAQGGIVLGTSKTIRDGQAIEWEHLRIEAHDDGTVTYWAFPSGQSPTTFTAPRATSDSVVFANPDHDFPQSITYRIRPDSLVVSIEGQTSDGFRQIFFPLGRIPCGG